MADISLSSIKEAVAGGYAAIRRVTRLAPQGEKVYPPTYEGGEYATERRVVPGAEPVETVLLDSVQSQANRMELALLRAYDSGRLRLPMLQVDFGGDGADSSGDWTDYCFRGAAQSVRRYFPRFRI